MLSSETKVKIASLLFGLGSWITITGFWQEVPILTDEVAEGWTLSSQLTLFIQAANIGPILYIIGHKYHLCNEVSATHTQMVVGVISCFILIFLWKTTVFVLGADRSVYLLVSAFGLSLLDCTSSVTFLPFMARFKDVHLTPYLIGEGLSGFLPIVVAMIQGSVEKDGEKALPCNSSLEVESLTEDFMSRTKERKEILFGPSIFFLSLLITLIVSWIAFFYLLYSKAGKKEYCHPVEAAAVESISMNPIGTTPRNMIRKVEGLAVPEEANFSGNSCNTSLKVPSYYVRRDSIKTYPYHIVKQDAKAIGLETEREKEVSDTEYFWLQGIIVFACLSTFGVFPPLQPYSTLPYGNWCMHYSVIATGLAYPVGASLALWKDASRLSWIVFWTILGTLISVYILVCAVLSPNPYLSDKTVVLGGLTESYIMGGVIMVSAWILYIGILSYVKTVVTVKVSRARGEGALFLVGLFTQIGSVFGAAFMFVAVNIFQWFKDSSCQ